jgi:uncharacterized protein
MPDAAEPGGAPFELERLELVFLRRPPDAPAMDDAAAEELQRRHIAYLTAMTDAGHILVAGPLDEQPDESFRGICLYRTGSVERARELAEDDPAVRAGKLAVDVMYWYCEKGAISGRQGTATQ